MMSPDPVRSTAADYRPALHGESQDCAIAFRSGRPADWRMQGGLPGRPPSLSMSPVANPFAQVQSRIKIMPVCLTRYIAALFLLVFCAALAVAGDGAGRRQAEARPIIDEQRAIIDRAEQAKPTSSNERSRTIPRTMPGWSRYACELEEMARDLLASGVAFRPRLSEINSRVEQLGPPPAEGQPPEPEIVTQERQALAAEKAEINAVLGDGRESLSIRVSGLIDRIGTMRRELFQHLLTKRYEIDDALVGEVLQAVQTETGELLSHRVFVAAVRRAVQAQVDAGGHLLCACGGRRASDRRTAAVRARVRGRPDDRGSVLSQPAVGRVLVDAAADGGGRRVPRGDLFFFDYFAVLRGDIGAMLSALFQVMGIVFFVHRLGKAVLSPSLPNWRLIPVEDRAARPLVILVSATAFFTGLDYFLTSSTRRSAPRCR